MLQSTSISSPAFRGTRKIWVEEGATDEKCLVFLDAELYIERVKAPEILRDFAPLATSVYLSFGEPIDRHIDFTCNEEFTVFIAEVLTKWIDNLTGRPNEYVLCGLSLSGLAAVYAAVRYPDVFSRILCQSPSAWWNDEWLAGYISGKELSDAMFWLSVGDQETNGNVTHEPSGMVQKTSQVSSCQRLADALAVAGATMTENLYEGGHEPAKWAAELPGALSWLGTLP